MTKKYIKHIKKFFQIFSPNRIFVRFLITYFIVILIPFSTIGLFTYRYYFQYMKETLEENCVSSLHAVHTIHNNMVQHLETISQKMYYSELFYQFELARNPEKSLDLINELTVLQGTSSYVDEIAFHFTGDNYIYTSHGSHTLEMFFNDVFVNKEIYTDVFLQSMFTSKTPIYIPLHPISGIYRNSEYVVFVYPVLKNGRVYSTVIFYISYDSYKEIMNISENKPEQSYIVYEGEIFFRSDNGIVEPATLAQMCEGDYTYKYLTNDESTYLAIHASAENFPFHYYRLVELNEVYAPLYTSQRTFFLINVVMLFICGICMFWFSQINYNPFRKVLNYIHSAPAPAPSNSKNELEMLLAGVEYICEQNKHLNLEISQNTEARRSVILVNFIKGRYSSHSYMPPLDVSTGSQNDPHFYSVWLVQFQSSSLLTSLDEESEFIFNQQDEDIKIYATELLSSNTLAVVAFYSRKAAQNQLLSKIHEQLQTYGFQGTIAISNPYSDYADAYKAFCEASTVLTQYTFTENIQILFFHELNLEHLHFDVYPFLLIEEFKKAITDSSPDKARNVLNKIIDYVKNTTLSHFFAKCILKDMTEAIIKESHKINMNCSDLYILFDKVSQIDSPDQFDQYTELLLSAFQKFLQQKEINSHTGADNLLPIIQYINETCVSAEFSLYNTAEHFQMSPSQLSCLFKENLHISPSGYIANYKMRCAKNLLSTTDLTITEICTQLGYIDTSNFIRKFRQFVGVTPAVYRKEHSDTASDSKTVQK